MKKYIIMIFLRDVREVFKGVETLLEKNELFNYVRIENFHLISFRTKESIDKVKKIVMDTYKVTPYFFILDITDEKGTNYDLDYGQVEPVILLQTTDINNVSINNDNMGLDMLLELVLKNGYESLTDKQKDMLKKLSEN
jgi:hypothetical protein